MDGHGSTSVLRDAASGRGPHNRACRVSRGIKLQREVYLSSTASLSRRALRLHEALDGVAQSRGQLIGLAQGHSFGLDRLTYAQRQLSGIKDGGYESAADRRRR